MEGKKVIGINLLTVAAVIILFAASAAADEEEEELWSSSFTRHDFPDGFVFGAGTSAYQVEGASDQDGRTPSIFDTFAHSGLTRGANGDIACDQYHKYKEDVELMVETGLDAYRFSISWSRLIPNGRGSVNPKGLEYYNRLIDELLSHGIEPHVTLHHSDLPQALEDEYDGFISRNIIDDFTAYANVCFAVFGDRVKYWTTFNEPNIFILGGYDAGFLPPQRCSYPFGFVNCTKGNSTTEPYLAAHNIMLAHASASRLYRERYRSVQKGQVGLNLFAYYFTPYTNTTEDLLATDRANDFYVGWFLNPILYGDYPETMKKNAGLRLPSFTADESELIKGSMDFLGINFYNTLRVRDNPRSMTTELRDCTADAAAQIIYNQDNTTSSFEFPVAPWGLEGLLQYLKQKYENIPIYIHENGQHLRRNSTLEDLPRVESMRGYIGALLNSVTNGSNVKGYFHWAFLDVFELLDGYESGFGLYYVDLDDPDLRRYPKLSARWYRNFLKAGTMSSSSSSSDSFIGLERNSTSRPHGSHSSQ
ncbi:hypothetical protein MLD38_025323 [Melastoma candidum]|uniref:Uncharacterized protein n=1 Tax=Melastoma candidum TaxID=119954 RepID=A0ACB9NV10_9MYRT|nr:hypothetical protein MLD38_025323 [Melastoma candidum]